jgi:DNA-binding transcriptional MerR regulator
VTPPARDSAGRRSYAEADVSRVVFVSRLRATGMPVREIRAYVELLEAAGSVPARLALLTAHRDALERRLAEASEHLRAINFKISSYEELV